MRDNICYHTIMPEHIVKILIKGIVHPCVRKDCLECGMPFWAKVRQLKIGIGTCCSVSCSIKYRCRKPEEEPKIRKGSHYYYERNCKYCEKKFWARTDSVKDGKGIFCGHTCSQKNLVAEGRHRGAHSGEKHHYWKGGLTPALKKIRFSPETNRWRKSVFERDDYVCQYCLVRGGTLRAHHILSFSKHPEKRFDVDNGITLCHSCHYKEHTKHRSIQLLIFS